MEMRSEDPVEPVELGFVLDQTGAGQVIEVVDALAGDAALHRLQQGQEFGYGRPHAAVPEHEEEFGQHRPLLRIRAPVEKNQLFEKMHILLVFQ